MKNPREFSAAGGIFSACNLLTENPFQILKYPISSLCWYCLPFFWRVDKTEQLGMCSYSSVCHSALYHWQDRSVIIVYLCASCILFKEAQHPNQLHLYRFPFRSCCFITQNRFIKFDPLAFCTSVCNIKKLL